MFSWVNYFEIGISHQQTTFYFVIAKHERGWGGGSGWEGGGGLGLLRAQFTCILIYLLKIMVPILHLPRNYWKLLVIKMLYVQDNFFAIDKYLKNDVKFK